MQTSTTTTTAMPASDRMSSAAIVLGVCVGGAVLLRYFLLAESWVTVLVLLACFASLHGKQNRCSLS